MSMSRLILATGLLTASVSAFAHTPYFAPLSFEANRYDKVTLDASFAEKFFVPDAAFNNSIYHIVTPTGKTINPDHITQLSGRTVVEHRVKKDGTYRFSTGRRLGKVFKIYELDGERKSLEDPSLPVPKGGKLLSWFQSNTMAEAYISKGAPTDKALTPYQSGLEFVANSHPSDLFVNEDLNMTVTFNGTPLENQKVDVYLAKYQAGSEKPDLTLTTNKQGQFSFRPETKGSYLLRARHRADAPENSPAPQISHTYTLVVEAAE